MREKIPIRAILIGSVLSFLTSIMCIYNMMVTISSFLAYDVSTPVCIFFVFIVGLINIFLKKKKPEIALSSFELVIIYSMVLVANVLPTFGLFLRFIPGIAGVYYFSTSVNKWNEIIWPHLRKWLFPEDLEAIKKFFEGIKAGEKIPYGIWLKPTLFWSFYFLVFFLFILTIISIFRKQWSEREHLSYPLVQLPDSIINDEGFFRNKLLWLGVFIPFVIGSIKAIHFYFPLFPDLKLMTDIPVFRRTTSISVRLSFITLGLTYFVPQDLAFSIWFFYLLLTLEQGIFNLTGYSLYQPVPFTEGRDIVVFQCAGAFLGYVFMTLWMSKSRLKELFVNFLKNSNEEGEFLTPKFSVFSFFISFILIWIFFTITGMSWWVAFIFLLLLTLIIIGISRGMSEGGLLTSGSTLSPQGTTFALFGTKLLNPSTISGIGLSIFHIGITRTTIAVNSLKIAEKEKPFRKRIVLFSLFLALIICTVSSIWMTLHLAYKLGGLNAHGWLFSSSPQGVWKYVAENIKHPTSVNKQALGFIGLGTVLYFIFSFMRYKFLWWPLNPVGLAFSGVYFILTVWFSVFLGWFLKTLILKYLGADSYKKARYFFLGLILGQILCVVFWFLIDVIAGARGNIPYWW